MAKPPEPDFRTACQWWPDLSNIWTPVGWREHMFRFNVLWNGTILAKPDLNRRTEAHKGQGLQLGFVAEPNNRFEDLQHAYLRHDDGQVLQGWADDDAPVLWSEWSREGLLLRQHVFAHVAGGQETRTGVEPLYAWVRLSVHALCPALPLEPRHGFHLLLHAPHISTSMSMRDNIRFRPEQSTYPRPLKPDTGTYDSAAGLRVLEEDGRVRLAVAPGGKDVTVEFFEPDPEKQRRPCHRLYVSLPARRGAKVDLLLPMLPADRGEFDAELALGHDGALKQSRRYWRSILAGGARFEVSEPEVNQAIRHSVRMSSVASERNPATGKLCKITGSWTYADLWATPAAMDLVMLLDAMGHHAAVGRYLEIFRQEQGTVQPPGDAYTLHDGYLSTPALYKSIDWLSDNGAILWTFCMHYLLSGDRAFLERFLDAIVRSCQWIKDSRALAGHGGYEGVLPPAVATDRMTRIQAIWSAGWNYKGLAAAVRILKEIAHPRAAEFEQEAAGYREAFLAALRHKCRSMPTWADRAGRRRRFVPTALAGDERSESRHAFYLDTGPLFPVFAGLLRADDPLMRDALAWFRQGPQREFYRRDSNCWQAPVLDHEMSSCEPCYSWNVFHSWQAGDRPRFLEGMYSLFAGAMSRRTWVSCETRGGVTGNIFAGSLAAYLARLAVVDDQIVPGELHLLRLVPPAWLAPGSAGRFEKLPTEFGPITLTTAVDKTGKRLAIEFRPRFRHRPARIRLHVPAGLARVTLNGQKLPRKRVVDLQV